MSNKIRETVEFLVLEDVDDGSRQTWREAAPRLVFAAVVIIAIIAVVVA